MFDLEYVVNSNVMKRLFLIVAITVSLCEIVAQNDMGTTRNENAQSAVHALGFDFSMSASFPAPIQDASGQDFASTKSAFDSELAVRYSCIFKNGFGFTLSIFAGSYQRTLILSPDEEVNIPITVGSPYFGISPQLSFQKSISQKVDLQLNYGIKFRPFYYRPDHWVVGIIEYNDYTVTFNDDFLEIPYSSYFVPDLDASVFFNIHGKRNRSNFRIGLFGNLSFVDRMIVTYNTGNAYGRIGFKSSAIGIQIGYALNGLKP